MPTQSTAPPAPLAVDAHAEMEMNFIREYLRQKGFELSELHKLPHDFVKQLMTEASTYASDKLTEIEARARFMDEVHGVTPPHEFS